MHRTSDSIHISKARDRDNPIVHCQTALLRGREFEYLSNYPDLVSIYCSVKICDGAPTNRFAAFAE